jgi:hypothetical protein
MTLKEANTALLFAGHVQAKESRAFALIAGHLEGNVKAVFTPLTALAAGAGFGLALSLAKHLLARLLPPKSRKQ